MRSHARMHEWRPDDGSSLVELVVALPILITVLVGAADFGRVFYHTQGLTAAARAGAAFAAISMTTSTDSTNITNTAIAAAPNLSLTNTNIVLGDSALTGNATAQVPQCAAANGASWANPTSAQPWDCSTSTCPAGQPTLVCYVKVTATKSFSTISGYVPGIPRPLSTSRTAWQRVK